MKYSFFFHLAIICLTIFTEQLIMCQAPGLGKDNTTQEWTKITVIAERIF